MPTIIPTISDNYIRHWSFLYHSESVFVSNNQGLLLLIADTKHCHGHDFRNFILFLQLFPWIIYINDKTTSPWYKQAEKQKDLRLQVRFFPNKYLRCHNGRLQFSLEVKQPPSKNLATFVHPPSAMPFPQNWSSLDFLIASFELRRVLKQTLNISEAQRADKILGGK